MLAARAPALDFSHSSPEFCHASSWRFPFWRTVVTTNAQKTRAAAKIPFLRRIDSLIGGAVCVTAALAASALAADHSWRVWVPLAFSAVPLLIAWFFGARAGILGTLLAAGVFAFFLFSPVRSIRVADQAARANLGWMMLIGIAFSLLFAPATSGFHRSGNGGETTERDSRAS
jgi:K+-sensing histidine kinase KdpD